MSHPEKALIENCSTGETVACMFNPKEYVFAKQNRWTEKPVKGQTVAHLEFSGGEPANLKLKLLFDTYETRGPAGTCQDVRELTKGLWNMMRIDPRSIDQRTQKGQPPYVMFKWGKMWSFQAVIESISQTFTLFDSDGTPVRAILDVGFKQIKDEGQYPRQNPTSGGVPGGRMRTVRAGETLAAIANEEYGDSTVWRILADANGLEDPRRLRSGQSLLIPPLEQ